MNRLYVAESTPSLTGAVADHRLSLRPSERDTIAQALAHEIGVLGVSARTLPIEQARWVKSAASDLKDHFSRGLVVSGDRQSASLHAICHAMNSYLGNLNQTVQFKEPCESKGGSIQDLRRKMNSDEVDTLFILGGNPAYNLGADLDFRTAITKVRKRIRLSEYSDETASFCQWSLPEAHFLETWGDGLSFDGTPAIQQPVTAPFYEGRSAIELFSFLSGENGTTAYESVRSYWKDRLKSPSFEDDWHQILRNGWIPEQRSKIKIPKLKTTPVPTPIVRSQTLEILFKEDPSVYDGRFANNGWLQELPRPITKLVWTNAVLISPKTANSKLLSQDDLVEITLNGKSVEGSVFILPGQPDDTLTVHLGYGRTCAGRVGNRQGFNAYSIQASTASYFSEGVQLAKTGRKNALATTQHHFSMEGRELIREGTLSQFKANPKAIVPGKVKQEGVAPDYVYSGAAWGMSIDVNSCIGCNACMIACQAENNIPIVGKDEVARGRSMHWIRVDRYFKGAPDKPEMVFQPVPCMHCETAPCEEVCPTGATNHSHEGLNQMVYNRCVGTRFCSNNCPYKVRRFNFFQYSDMKTSLSKMAKNPDVTVRSRGVMEKCSYCVQRIQEAKIEAELENRNLKDGDVLTACQASCPTEAIIFGDLNDPSSRVSRLKREPLDYFLLEELGTKPRTSYLAKLRNPSPSLSGVNL
jgi:molybdopterin-containing oxidoreductase family iron-sulfur binding subunit